MNLYLTAQGTALGTFMEMKRPDGSDHQLWALDPEGRLFNKASGLVIEWTGKVGINNLGVSLVSAVPITKRKQWKYTTDVICKSDDPNAPVPKLVNNHGSCPCLQGGIVYNQWHISHKLAGYTFE